MKKDIYAKLFKKIKKNSKVAIFGTNETAINIHQKLKELRNDITTSFFISSQEEGILNELPIFNLFNDIESKLKEIDCVIIASYSKRYFFENIFKMLNAKQTISITKDFITNNNTPFKISKTIYGLEITIFNKTFDIKNKRKIYNETLHELYTLNKTTTRQRDNINFILSNCDINHCKKADGTIRLLQETRLLALKKLIAFFEENNIEYWADFGTLIGAYRHKGYIPWDDDIDLAMTRENYTKTIELLNKNLEHSNFEIHIGKYGYSSLFRFGDRETTIPLVDVFVYDYCDNEELSASELSKKILSSRKEMLKKYPKSTIRSDIFATTNKIKEIYEIYKNNGLHVNTQNPHTWLFRGIETMSKCRKASHHLLKDIYPLKKVQFEDIEISVPNNELAYLKGCNDDIYGNILDFPNYNLRMIPKISYNEKEKQELSQKLNKIQENLKSLF